MSKVVFTSQYVSCGKAVGGGYVNYMAKRDRVDKSINTKKVEINMKYIATRPRVEKVGDVLKAGDEVNAKIIEINYETKKISLSIKAALPEVNADEAEAETAAEDAVVEE